MSEYKTGVVNNGMKRYPHHFSQKISVVDLGEVNSAFEERLIA